MNNPPPSAFDWNRAWIDHWDKLPHVRQPNVVYFVTFRLNDSLPAQRVTEIRQRRDQWLKINPFSSFGGTASGVSEAVDGPN